MCGIVACMALDPKATVPNLNVGAAALTHRGPEGQYAWTSPNGRVTLAHTRLRIIDLVTGDQPIPNEDESVWAVVNGEFYGYKDIRRDLERAGHKFKTKSDSEILLHLYEDRGTSALHWLNGEYAFVLWDHNNRELVAGRDRFGIKPLCYAAFDGKLFLASEAKALFALGVPADLDSESVYQYLHVSQDPDRTFFKYVRQVPPGHYLLARNGNIRLIPYWDHDVDSVAEPLDESAVVKEFESRLSEAVRLRLIADVPVGIYLSGGIDSSAAYALACRYRCRTVRPPKASSHSDGRRCWRWV